MIITYKPKGAAAHIWGLIKLAVVVSMFFQYGLIAGILSIVLVIEVND